TLAGGDVDANVFAARWLVALEARSQRFVQDGFAPFSAEFNAAHAYHDDEVELRHEGRVVASGRFEGVGRGGEVVLRDAAGVRHTHLAGDLSLRRAPG